VLQIVPDVGMVLLQAPAGRVGTIGLFGDGQADDADTRIRHRADHGARILGGDQNGAKASDDARCRAGAVTLQRRIEPVLRHDAVALVRPLQADADHPPGARLGGEEILRIERLMRADEGPETEMDDAGIKPIAIVARALRSGARAGQGRGRQPGMLGGHRQARA
jgi:hypothetical protein